MTFHDGSGGGSDGCTASPRSQFVYVHVSWTSEEQMFTYSGRVTFNIY